MSGPERVRLKRRRSELPLDTLIVEPSSKRDQTSARTTKVRYVRQQEVQLALAIGDGQGPLPRKPVVAPSSKRKMTGLEEGNAEMNGDERGSQATRTFHLRRPETPEGGNKKRKVGDDGLATFVEQKPTRGIGRSSDEVHGEVASAEPPAAPPERLKRPGRGSYLQPSPNGSKHEKPDGSLPGVEERKAVETLADDMHQFALEGLSREPNRKPVAQPKLSAARSRELHRERMSTSQSRTQHTDGDVEMDDESDYVYDTYVLAPAADPDYEQMSWSTEPPVDLGKVGFLVIEAANQTLWEAYMEDEVSSEGTNSEEEDENAEDYYGADYPEGEMASDDEHNKGAYGYRGHAGSDDEQWDEDTGTWSDEEEDRMMNPFARKTPLPRTYSKYLRSEDDEGE